MKSPSAQEVPQIEVDVQPGEFRLVKELEALEALEAYRGDGGLARLAIHALEHVTDPKGGGAQFWLAPVYLHKAQRRSLSNPALKVLSPEAQSELDQIFEINHAKTRERLLGHH